MSTVWKVLLGLALVLPMGGYVAGSLAASAADDPQPRQTIQIREPDRGAQPTHTPSGTPDPSHSPSGGPSDDVEVIVPDYDDYDDHDDHGDDDHGDDDHGDDDGDHSGHGGDDGHSGHGHGGED